MTLAITLACLLACPSVTLSAGGVSVTQDNTAQQTSASSPKAATQSQSGTATSQGESTGTTAKPAHPKPRHRKPTSSNCLDTTATNAKPTGPSSSASNGAASVALKPCPPKKTVVRNGGTTEPPVQLTGTDPAKQPSQATTTELLAATEENLKKLSGRELNADQQQTLTQIRQFMEQSRQATAAGDLEQAQNLASKARLLSDELVKP